MRQTPIVLLVVLSLLLVACSKTEVVKVDQNNEQVQPSEPAQTNTTQQPHENPSTSTEGKIAVKCEDSDGDDVYTSGDVKVKYNDGSEQTFIDECPAKSNIQVEYVCDGNNVKTKNTICDQLCVAGICLE